MSTSSLEDLRRDCIAQTPQPYWREPTDSKGLRVAQDAQAALKAERMAEEREAFIRAALTLKRLSWVPRRWALEEEAKGNLERYRSYAAEAKRLWRAAKWHLDMARDRS